MATLLVSHSMTFTNPSLQVTKNHTLELNETAVNRPQPGQVLLHVRATGICGSDIHFWKTGAIGELKVLGNCTLGHEAAGEVIEVGENVTNVAAGDRVAIEPGVPCGNCFLCSQGDYNLCEQVQFIGVYPYHGSMQRFWFMMLGMCTSFLIICLMRKVHWWNLLLLLTMPLKELSFGLVEECLLLELAQLDFSRYYWQRHLVVLHYALLIFLKTDSTLPRNWFQS